MSELEPRSEFPILYGLLTAAAAAAGGEGRKKTPLLNNPSSNNNNNSRIIGKRRDSHEPDSSTQEEPNLTLTSPLLILRLRGDMGRRLPRQAEYQPPPNKVT
jgi:hypothetical protein